MAVAATVVAKMELLACRIVATVNVAAKGRGAALAQGVEGAGLPTVGTITGKVLPVALQYLRYFIIGAGHPLLAIEPIQRAERLLPPRLCHMEVDKGGLDIGVPQEVLHAHDVQAHFQKMGGIAMA